MRIRLIVVAAAVLAAAGAVARALWLDDQAVRRADRDRETFEAGRKIGRQEGEWVAGGMPSAYTVPPPLGTMQEFRDRFGRRPDEGPTELAQGYMIYDGPAPRPDNLDAHEEPEGIGWLEFGGPHEDPDRG